MACQPARSTWLAGAPLTTLASLVWQLAVLVLVALAWNLRADAAWAWCVMRAVVPAARLVIASVMLPLAPLALVLGRAARRLDGRGIEPSLAYRRTRAAGQWLIDHGNAAVARIYDGSIRSRSVRVVGLVRLVYVPLLVMLWLR